MGLVLVTVVLGVLAGWAAGGRLRRLEHLPFRGLPLLGGAVLALFAGAALSLAGLPARPTYGAGLAAAGGLALAFCVRSRAVQGLGLVGAGLLLNALVVTVNGGMPVSAAAAARAGADPAAVLADARHVPAGAGTALRALADVIPVPLPLRPEVDSAGDVLVAAGLAQLLATAMLGGRPAAPAGSAPAGAGAGFSLPYRRRPASRPPTGPAAGAAAPARRAVLVAERRGAVTVWRAAGPADADADSEPVPRAGAT